MSGANPFVGYGTVASGGRFVGREAEIAALRSRLYEARSSAALIGLTRMGKSSLANKIISEPPDPRTASGWVNIATAQSGAEVFADILAMCPSPEGREPRRLAGCPDPRPVPPDQGRAAAAAADRRPSPCRAGRVRFCPPFP
jgi:hypothetical protein